MNKIQFKCILESDVIINQNAATEGNQQTLDFIPGSAFLGVQRSLYIREDSETFILFHSGKSGSVTLILFRLVKSFSAGSLVSS